MTKVTKAMYIKAYGKTNGAALYAMAQAVGKSRNKPKTQTTKAKRRR